MKYERTTIYICLIGIVYSRQGKWTVIYTVAITCYVNRTYMGHDLRSCKVPSATELQSK